MLISILVASWLVAVILIAIGLRGRLTGMEPRCGTCGYSFVGLDDNARCPECHALAWGPNRRTRRRVRSRPLVLGGLGVSGVAALLTVGAWWMTQSTAGIFTHMPNWLLLQQNPRDESSAQRYMWEILTRLANGNFSEEEKTELAQRAEAVALAHHWEPMSPKNEWPILWARVHAELWEMGEVDDNRLAQILAASTSATAHVLPPDGPVETDVHAVRISVASANLNNLGRSTLDGPQRHSVNGEEGRGWLTSVTWDSGRGSAFDYVTRVNHTALGEPMRAEFRWRIKDSAGRAVGWLVIFVEIPGFEPDTSEPSRPCDVRVRLIRQDPAMDVFPNAVPGA